MADMTNLQESQYRHVQGLSRGLALIHAINSSSSGCVTINELSAHTGLHRTTIRRLLETLLKEGYVRRSNSDGSYRLQHKVRELSDGFTDDEWISEVANPVLGELLQKLVWPSDLCTIDGTHMLVRETTHRFSPLSFHRAMVRQRLPILSTAAGRAYLAFCSEEERHQILRLLVASDEAQSQLAKNEILVQRLLEKVRRQGYATNESEWTAQSKISALGLPIRRSGYTLGSINVVFLSAAMTVSEAVERYLPSMNVAVLKIEGQLESKREV